MLNLLSGGEVLRSITCSRVFLFVLCAKDQPRAVRAAYAQEPVQGSGQCDTTGLDENEAFAKKHGFTGTPVLVRADGAVLEGYRPRAALIAWLKGDAS